MGRGSLGGCSSTASRLHKRQGEGGRWQQQGEGGRRQQQGEGGCRQQQGAQKIIL